MPEFSVVVEAKKIHKYKVKAKHVDEAVDKVFRYGYTELVDADMVDIINVIEEGTED
jgi:hypothetical protein